MQLCFVTPVDKTIGRNTHIRLHGNGTLLLQIQLPLLVLSAIPGLVGVWGWGFSVKAKEQKIFLFQDSAHASGTPR